MVGTFIRSRQQRWHHIDTAHHQSGYIPINITLIASKHGLLCATHSGTGPLRTAAPVIGKP